MASLDSADVAHALKTKLRCVEERDRDHIWFELYDGSVLLARTKISHGASHPLGDTLIHLMAVQMRLGTNNNFLRMVRCQLNREDCLAIIKNFSGQPPMR